MKPVNVVSFRIFSLLPEEKLKADMIGKLREINRNGFYGCQLHIYLPE